MPSFEKNATSFQTKRHPRLSFLASASLIATLATAARAQANTTNITCVGDSITAGYKNSSGHDYPTDLGQLLGSNYAAKNFGVSGTTLMKTGDAPYWSTGDFTSATTNAGAGPGEVVIQLGTNDTKPQNATMLGAHFLSDCEALVDNFLTLSTKPRVWVNLPPPAAMNAYTIDGTVLTQQVLPLLRQCAADKKVGLIDVNSAVAPFPQLFVDGVHPGDTGAVLIAQVVYNALLSSPTVTLTAPATGSSFATSSSILLTATATAAYGVVEKVDFLDGTTVIGTSAASPYTFAWSNAAAGSHTLTARVTETAGGTGTSTAVTITIGSGSAFADAGAGGGAAAAIDGGSAKSDASTANDAAASSSPSCPPSSSGGCAVSSTRRSNAGAWWLGLGAVAVVTSRRRRGFISR